MEQLLVAAERTEVPWDWWWFMGRITTMDRLFCARGKRLLIAAVLTLTSTIAILAKPPIVLEPTKLYLQTGTIDTGELSNVLDNVPDAYEPGRHYVLQLDGPITPQRRQALENAGIVLGDYLPLHAYLVNLKGVKPGEIAKLDFVQWIGPYQDAWKLSPDVGHRLTPFKTQKRIEYARNGQLELVVTLFNDRDLAQAQTDLANLGATILNRYEIAGQGVIDLVIDADLLPQLPMQPAIQFVEEAGEFTLRNSTTRWIVQSNVNGETPLYDHGLKGTGQIVGIMDGKIDPNHCSFFDDAPFGPDHRKIIAYHATPGTDVHGTHVAGTAVGDAGSDDNTRGIAYLGKLDYSTIPSNGGMNSRLTRHHDEGARVHSNSWGDDGTTSYNSLSRAIDVFSYEHEESLVLFAVTNTSTLKNPENAKDLIAVGASRDTPRQNQFCSGGRGPTSDGRRKPELYAPGCGTNSSKASTNCAVRQLTGTSMACPAVAGTAMLVRQYYTDGFYPTGKPNAPDKFTPSAALVKATMMNAGVDMTGINGYPSDREGWGRVLADEALFFAGEPRTLAIKDLRNSVGLSTGQQQTLDFDVLSSDQKIKVTLVWTDPPASVGTNFAAINDLDLQVVNSDGTLYKGNVFSGGESVPGGNKDDRNNVEQVHVSSPAAGTWTAIIRAAEVNEAKQGYALVITGEISSDGGGNGNPTCDDVKKLKAKCKDNGTIKGKVRMSSSQFNGFQLTVLIDDNVEIPITLEGKKARFGLCCFSSGQHTVSLTTPDCPDLDKTLTCN